MTNASDTKDSLSAPAQNSTEPVKRNSWRRLALMVAVYSLGTFNDNFFKQIVLFLAIAAGLESIQSLGTVLYALPFIFCSAWAGWLACRPQQLEDQWLQATPK